MIDNSESFSELHCNS